jgi:RNA polymerase sigma factor (sigma-70 family)
MKGRNQLPLALSGPLGTAGIACAGNDQPIRRRRDRQDQLPGTPIVKLRRVISLRCDDLRARSRSSPPAVRTPEGPSRPALTHGTVSAIPTSLDDPLDSAGFVSEMRPALVKYFKRKTGNPVEAEDLAQDVLLRALTHSNWKTHDQAKGYIFRTAVNRWRDSLRRQRIRGVVIAWDEASPHHADDNAWSVHLPERVLMARQKLKEVARALDGMNVRTRTVLMLIKLEDMRTATVAQMLGISVSAVDKHLAKGIARLVALR